MLKRIIIYTCLVLVAVLSLTKVSFGQTCANDAADYNTLDGGNSSVVDGGYACPSLDLDKNGLIDESVTVGAFHEVSSTTVFSVEAVIDGAGDLSKNTFEWVVYGGWITEINGTTPIASQPRTTDNIRYSCLSGDGVVGSNSVITVEWDTTNYSPTSAWVAVRQISEWGCSNGEWRVMTIDLRNDAPQFTAFPTPIHLPYDISLSSYTLPLPTATDAVICNQPLAYTVKVENPVGTTIFTGTDGARDVNLNVGDNLVTWTVSDGSRFVSQSYIITVEPNLEILHVATINPFCGSNGTALVTNITNVAGNLYTGTIEYSFDGGANWSASSSASLLPGDHKVQAHVVYSVDYDNDGDADPFIQNSLIYDFTLTANATDAVDEIPAADEGSNVIATSCGNGSEGQISVGTMNAQNYSVTFNGTNYLLLNKSYTGEVTAFSAAAWIKTSSQSGTILSFNSSEFYQIQLNAGRVSLASHSTNPAPVSNGILVTDSKYKVDDGKWHLVVATYKTGKYTIYVDGEEAATNTFSNENSIGQAGVTYFGAVGTGSKTTDFLAPVIENGFFSGQIAEIGIWDTELLAADVRTMKRKGMATVFATDHWALNAGPGDISSTSSSVFTDVGNLANQAHWGRFVNNPTRTQDSPVLYSWGDNPTDPGTGYTENTNVLSYDRIILNIGDPGLKTGSYELTASDIFGCGNVTQEFVVPNGDDEPPYFLWNASANKQARQSTTVNDANLASDALLNTSASTDVEAANESWWDVDLGNTYPIGRVQLYPGGTLDNVWVMISGSPFGVASTLADDQSVGIEMVQQIAGSVSAGQYVSFPNTNARFVRIRCGAQGVALALNEVVVLTNYPTPELRKLYLNGVGECEYQITANDAVIDPIPVDACGNPMKSLTYITNPVITRESDKTLVDEDDGLPLYTQFEATWIATDENDKPATLKMRYEVVDEEKPVIHGDPFSGVDATMSYCKAQTYPFPIPIITDNLDNCTGKYLQNITLFIDGFPVTLDDDDEINTSTYDHATPRSLDPIPFDMKPGTHNFEWRVKDFKGNETISEPYTIYVQKKPQLEEISYVPILCRGENNGAVYFSQMQSENDNNPDPLLPITYRLTNVADANVFVESPSPVISTSSLVLDQTYKASFIINGCPSNFNYQLITITDPEEIQLNELVTNVLCWGNASGAIDVSPSGGNQTTMLHLVGPESEVSASAYSALDLTSQGMIEAWVFLDDLNANGVDNLNAGIFGRLGCYGLKLVGGVPVFYIGDGTVSTSGTAQLPVRQWVHLAGSFNWDGTNGTGTATLYVNGSAEGSPATLTAAPPAAGSIAMGSLGVGGDTDNLRGFVRNARIWNAIPNPTAFSANRYLVTPIDNNNNVVANYPMNEASGGSVANVKNSAANGTVSGPYNRQQFAYYWQKPDNSFLQFSEDLTLKEAGTYTVTLYDAAGCVESFTPKIEDADFIPPTLTFYTTRLRDKQLDIGVPIVRYTDNDDGAVGNAIDDCVYVPYSVNPTEPGEFDPDIDDDICNTDLVTLIYQPWEDGIGDWGTAVETPLIDLANADRKQVTLNNTNMTGIRRIKWRAQDRSQERDGKYTDREVTYYIVDNEAPSAIFIDENNDGTAEPNTTHVSVPADKCEYTVTNGAFIPKITDNCLGTGKLTNDYNGKDNLNGEILPVKTHTIKWTYTDRKFPNIDKDPFNGDASIPYSIEFTHTLIVEDNTPPSVTCRTFTDPLYLGDEGKVTLRTIDVLNDSKDNCLTPSTVLTNNIANGMGGTYVSASTEAVAGNRLLAVDNSISSVAASGFLSNVSNGWWQINLGGVQTFYGVRLFASDAATLSNFWIVVHNEASFTNPPDLSVASPAWVGNVTEAIFVPGPIASSQSILFDHACSGQYVRIIKADANPLGFAEVEVYGSATAQNSVTFTCVDARHTPHPTPRTAPDTYDGFDNIGVLLSAIDVYGNVSSCLSDIKLVDDIHPTVLGAGLNVSPDATGLITIDPTLLGAPSTDNCEIADYWTYDVLGCSDKGSNNITLWVMDEFGNKSSALVSVNVDDKVKPIARAKASVIIELDEFGEYTITDPKGFLEGLVPAEQSSDNCNDIVLYSVTPNEFKCADVPTANIPLTYTVTDGSTNVSDPITILADVQDNRPPTSSIQNFNLTLKKPGSGPSIIYVSDFDAGGFDNCGISYVGICYDVLDLNNLCMAGFESGGAANDCKEWTCADVGTHTAYIVYQPSSGGAPLIETKSFEVLPYFTIDDVQLKDCSVSGEQYWSWVTNAPNNFRYTWQQQNYDNNTDHDVLSIASNPNTGARGAKVNFTTTTTASVRINRYIQSGNYTIRLTVTDMSPGNSGCTSSFDRSFTWDENNGGGAQTDKQWKYCKDAVASRRFDLDLVAPNSYYGCFFGTEFGATCTDNKPLSYNWYNVWATKTWVNNASMQKVGGGGANDKFIDVRFPVASATPYNVWGDVGGVQRYVLYGNDGSQSAAPTMYVPGPGSTADCTNGCYDFGANFTGPFNLADATLIDANTYPQLSPDFTSSVNNGANPISYCYDGNNATYSITAASGAGSITYNYTNPINVAAIKLRWYQTPTDGGGRARRPTTASIQFSPDNSNWTPDAYVSTTPNSSLYIQIPASNIRYVRLNFTSASNRRVAVADFRIYEFDYTKYDIAGRNVVRPGASAFAPCNEGVNNIVTIVEVAPPVITGKTTDICPLEQVTYVLPEPDPDPDPTKLTYTNYNWTITGGRKVSGGGGSDNTVTVEWNMSGWPVTPPSIALEITNELGCSASNSWPITYISTGGINFVAASKIDITQNADVGSCAHTFPSITPPVVHMPNSCVYKSLECSTDGGSNWKTSAAGTYTGIGDHLVQWRARDYFFIEGAPDADDHEEIWTQTITIVDAEQPRFDVGKTPSNTTLQTDASTLTCGMEFPDASCDVDATDGGDCTPKANLVFTREWYNPDRLPTAGWEPLTTTNGPAASNIKTLQGIYFNVGVTRVRYTVTDGKNPRDIEFNVTVQDKTPPTFTDLADVVCNTDLDQQYASFASVSAAGLAVPANPGMFTDNCPVTDAEFNSTVTLVSRSDGGNDITKNYPIGPTVLEWRVADNHNNYTTKFQNVDVSDKQPPWFEASATEDLSLQKSISYCARNGYQLGIPTPRDNYKVKSIRYVVTNNSLTSADAGYVVVDQTLTNFNPLGTGITVGFDITGVNANSTTNNYTVTWTAIDEKGNTTEDVIPTKSFSYQLHVEREPLMGDITDKPMSCGGAYDAQIIINNNSIYEPGLDALNPYLPEYSIDYGANWLLTNTFKDLGNQTYNVRMRVNNCLSRESTWKTVTFTAPDPYKIRIDGKSGVCEEDKIGEASVKMDQGGGAKGQWLFTGSNGLTVTNYNDINLTTPGAIEAWVYLNSLGDATIVQKGTSPNGYGLLVNNSKFALWVGNSSVLESAYAITTNRWYHVSAWWDAGSMNIAVDGSINKTTVNGTYDANTLAGNLTLGGSGFNGILRTVRIWKSTVSGNISSSAIPVADPNLVGYWEINEGGLTSAVNFRFPAYPATASSASWATDSVQPGYYTWTRNGSDFPIASDKSNIYLKNLEKGRYEVTFIDPYNCPTTGISTFFNVLATDIVLPAISFAPATTLPLHVGTDAGDCSYLFDSDPLPANPLITDVEYYTPIVADLSGCDYTITWQVIPVDGNSTTYMKKVTDADPVDDRIKGMFVTREVTNGSNRVRVTVSQNGKTLDPPFEYYIIVDDIEAPKAEGKTTEVTSLDLDNTPGGGGKVTYYAWQFDGGSSDNCTKILKDMKPEFAYENPILNPGTTWYESVNLGCSAIGNSVLLNYRVRDQANNPDPNYSDPISVNTSIPVKDVHKPVFNSTFVEHASVCAEDDDADALPAYTLYSVGPLTIVEGTAATSWKDYTDNCGVKHIQYKLVNTTCASCGTGWEDAVTNIPAKTSTISSDEKFYVGTTEVWYRLTDMDSPTTDADWTAQVMFKVVVLPQPTPGTTAPVSGGTTGIN